MSHPESFQFVLPYAIREGIERYAGATGKQRKLAEFVRTAVKRDLDMRDRYRERYDVVASLTERLPPEVVEAALLKAAGRA